MSNTEKKIIFINDAKTRLVENNVCHFFTINEQEYCLTKNAGYELKVISSGFIGKKEK